MSQEKNFKFYIVVIVTLALMFGFGYLPTFSEVTPNGMRVLGIFLGCIFAWCFGEIAWSSILGIICLTLFDLGSMNENFASAYGNGTAAMLLVAIVFCFAIEQSGLLSEMASWITGQKWAQKNPWSLVFAFYLAAMIIGAMATNIVPPIVLLWALFYELAREIGIKPYERFSAIILLGIGVVGYVGCMIMPYNIMTVTIRGVAEGLDPNFVYDIPHYLMLNLLVAVIFLPLLVLVLKLLFGRSISFRMPKKEVYKIKLNLTMKWTLGYLTLLVFLMTIPNFLPDENFFREVFGNKLGILGCLMLLCVAMSLTKVNGRPILDISEGLKNASWSMFLLVSAALSISGYLTLDEMGIVKTIITFLDPLVSGHSAFAVTLIFIVLGLIVTNFINDIVTAVVLYPIAVAFIAESGGSIMLFTLLFGQATMQGCFMPSGSIAGAMFHGNTEWMRAKDVFFYISIMEIVLLMVVLFVTLIGRILAV